MGSGLLVPPLSEVTKSCAFVVTGKLAALLFYYSIDPDVSAVRRLG
jgi:hypothetical protein